MNDAVSGSLSCNPNYSPYSASRNKLEQYRTCASICWQQTIHTAEYFTQCCLYKLSLLKKYERHLWYLGGCLLLINGCNDLIQQDELIYLEPFYQCQERLNKLPECTDDNSLERCIVKSTDQAGYSTIMPYLNGQLSGIGVTLFSNGNLKGIYTYSSGKRNGFFSEFYENGVEQSSGHYEQDKLQGVLKSNYPNGITQSLAFYKDSEKNGYSNNFNQDGSLFSQSQYSKSKLLNPVRTFHLNGDITDSYYDGSRISKISILHPNGEIERFVYQHNQFNGFAQAFYSSGQLRRSVKIVNGHKEGLGVRYYTNGQIQGLYQYKNGKLNGRTTHFDQNGEIHFVLNYYYDRLESGTCNNGQPLTPAQLILIQKGPFASYPEFCPSK